MIGYKIFRKRADGSYGPLFHDVSKRMHIGETFSFEVKPTKGLALRPGFHICRDKQGAPHIKVNVRNRRVWCKVAFELMRIVQRPTCQGGEWYLASKMTILEECV